MAAIPYSLAFGGRVRSGRVRRERRRLLIDQGAGPSSVSVVEVREHDDLVRRRGIFG